MLQKNTLLRFILLAIWTPPLSPLAASEPIQKRPNILVILADDMGYSDIGCYGGEIATPNLDSLAHNGIRYTQMHNTSKCYPSRACLLTGVYAQQCGMDRTFKGIVNAATIGDVARSAGYRTLATGKHHSMQSLFDKGFDRYFGLRDGASNHFNPGLQREGEKAPAQKRPGKRYWSIDDKVLQPYTPKEKDFYSTDYFTKYALDYLEEYKDENKPFLLYVSYTAPHDPLQAWPEDIKKYQETYKVGYEAIRSARFKKMRQLGMIQETSELSKQTHKSWQLLSSKEQEDEALRMAVYAAMIDCMDQNIGAIINKLKALGKFDNTLILFASDNGSSAENVEQKFKRNAGQIGEMTYWASLGKNWANVSNTPLRFFKNSSHQGGICTPFIAHWPAGIKNPGSLDHNPRHFIDLMPTVLDLTKASYPKKIREQSVVPYQGESMLPLFIGKPTPEREKPIFWKWGHGKSIRSGKWKALNQNGNWLLFNMQEDPSETHNIASKYPEKLKHLSGLFLAWESEHTQAKKK